MESDEEDSLTPEKYIRKQMKKANITRDLDVNELYLSNCTLEEIPDLCNYKNINRLYLNKNKILRLGTILQENYNLTELYLQNNKLVELNNALHHLTSLRILLLHCNQLTLLTDVVYELRYMQDLKVLNLFMNPLTQEYNYRAYIIDNIKSLELLDRKSITKDERDKVFQKFNERQALKDSIAFGSRILGKTLDPLRETDGEHNYTVEEVSSRVSQKNLTTKASESLASVGAIIERKNMTPELVYKDAIERRGQKRSVMEYKTFCWKEILQNREATCSKRENIDPIVFTVKLR